MTQYSPAASVSDPTAPVYNERVAVEPEVLETNSGRVVAMIGMHILESDSVFGDVFVVHPDDLSNANLWVQV